MKFFLGGLGNWYNDYPKIQEMILEADKLGFNGALIPDHYMWGNRNARMDRPDRFKTVDSWIALTYLAGKTEHIKLGTLVTPIPFRPPGMLAKMLATLDNLSNGRVILGVGAGWSKEEFDGYAEWSSDKERVDKTKEGLDLILKLWTEEKVTFSGKHYKAQEAVIDPKPVQKPYPPLLFGGTGNRMLAMAGKYGDIVYVPPWSDSQEFQNRKQRVIDSAKKHDRLNKIEFMSGTMMGPATGDLKTYPQLIENAIKNGDKIFLPSFGRGDSALILLKGFAKDIIPSFS